MNDKRLLKEATTEAVSLLLTKAEELCSINTTRSSHYVKMAWELIKKNKVRLSQNQKQQFCKKCFSYWKYDKTMKVVFNLRNVRLEIHCTCGYKKPLLGKSVMPF